MRFLKPASVVLICLLAVGTAARAEVMSGTYTGNGAGTRQITGIGFRPEVVVVKGDIDESAVIRTATMPAGTAKQLAQDQPPLTNRIRAFTADGFEIGSDADVNAAGVTYAWVAFSANPGDLKVGTYTGNGNVLQNVTGVGFQPELVFVIPDHSSRPCWRSGVMPASRAMPFDAEGLRTGLINGFSADGFQVSWGGEVNQWNVTYYYVAWNASVGGAVVGSYAGNGASSQNIDSIGFRPEWVLVKTGDNLPAVQKPRGLGGYESGFVTPQPFTVDGVREMLGLGFRVGTDDAVNDVGRTYYYAAFDDVDGNAADLAVSIAADPPDPTVGSEVTYSVTLRNDGPDDATGVAAAMVLPAGLAYVSHGTGSGTYNGTTGVWTVGDVARNATSTLTVTARLDAGAAGQVLTSTIGISASDASDPDVSDNTASAAVTVAPSDADLAVALTVDDATPDEAQDLAYTLTVTNLGPGEATGVELQVSLPAGLVFVEAAPGGGTFVPGTGRWDAGSLASGASLVLTVTARPAEGTAGQTLAVGAAIAATDQPDPVAANDAAAVDVVVASSDLAVALTTSDATPDEGQVVTFTVAVTNQGPNANAGVVLAVALPAGLSHQSHVAGAGIFEPATGTWSVGDLAVAQTATLQVMATVAAGTGGSTLTVVGVVTAADRGDPAAANDEDSATVVVTSADLAVSLAADNPTPNPGDPVAFTVTLTNHGPDAATAIEVTVTLPPELTFVSSDPASGGFDAGTGVWTVDALAHPGATSLLIQTTVDGAIGGNLLTSATITGAAQSDPVAANDLATVAVGVTSADLALAMSVSDDTPDVHQSITCTLVLTNQGPDAASGVAAAVAWPDGLTQTGHIADLGTFDPLTGAWTVGDLAAGAAATLNVTAAVDAGSGGQILDLLAGITASDQGDAVVANNTASQTVTVTSADLGLALVVDDATPNEGQQIRLDLTLANAGPDDASGTRVAVGWPAGLTFVSSDGAYDDATGVWNAGNVASGGSVVLRLTAHAAAGTGGATLTTTASVAAADQSDPVPANDLASVAVVVTSADLGLNLTVSDAAPDEGDAIDYVLTLSNHGPDPATAVAVTAVLPAGVAYAGSDGAFDDATGIWTVGTLAAEAATTLRITATVGASTAGTTLTATAGVSAVDQSDPDPTNDTATAAFTVRVPTADLGLSAAFAPAAAPSGDTTVLQVRLANDGPDAATAITVVVSVPGLLTVTGVDAGPGAFDAASGRWQLATLAVGAADTLLVTCGVGPAAAGSAIVAQATVDASDQADSDPADDVATATFTVAAPPALRVVARPFAEPRRHLLPGGQAEAVLRVDVINTATAAAALNAVTVQNLPAVGADQTSQDAAWAGLELRQRVGQDDLPVPVVPGGSSSGVFAGGSLTFGGLGLVVSPGDTLHLVLRGSAALDAPDGLELSPRLADASALTVPGSFTVEGAWPLAADGVLAVDGMTAAQITLHPIGAEVFQLGSVRNVAFDVTLPGNGGEADHLTRFNVRNHGTATPGTVLTRLELWADDGDDTFDAAADTRIAPLTWTGDRWEATGLWHAVPAAGLRTFVTVDVAEDALGGTVTLGLPAGDDTGVGMASGNDGPIDEPVINPFVQTVSATDRVIATTAVIPSAVVAPGQAEVLVLHLLARNLYGDTRRLTRLQVRNAGRSQSGATQAERDAAVSELTLRRDGNGDGVLGSVAEDPVLGTTAFVAGKATFAGLDHGLTPGEIAHLFLTADVSRTAAADGDTLAVLVGSAADLEFDDGVALVGAWPLDSQCRHRVDGMVAAQIANLEVPPVSLTAGEGPVLAFGLTIPGNGYLADTLTQIRLTNVGSATTADIASLQLWADDGDHLFTPGTDQPLGDLAGVGASWIAPGLDVAIPADGLQLFAGLTVGTAPADSATVQFRLPIDGATVASANDGPRDAAIESPTSLLISTAPLLSHLQIAAARSTLGQTVTVMMTVANASGETVTDIAPQDIAVGGDGVLTPLTGPSPAALDLGSGASGTFVWTFRADATGDVHVRGRCSGVGAVGGQPRHSLGTASGSHRILNPALPLGLYPVANLPFSINRGQAGVVPLTLTLVNGGDDASADIRLTRLVMTIDDGEGQSVVPADLLARVAVNEGVNVYCNTQDVPASGSSMVLDLAPYVVVTSREPVTLSLRLDIRSDTDVRRFRVSLVAAGDITALDHVSLLPVAPVLLAGAFPVSSGTGHIVAQATGLNVARGEGAAATASAGQDDVELLRLDLQGAGDPAFPTDVQIGAFTVALVDTLGRRLPDASARFQRLRVLGSLAMHAENVLDDPADTTVTFQLMPPVNVPVGAMAVSLRVLGQVPAAAALGPVRLRLESSTLFDARDGNVGVPVPVYYQPAEIQGPTITLQAPATALAVAGTPRLPDHLTVGATGVPALTLRVTHPAGTGTAAVTVDTLRLVCRDDGGRPLDPAGICDRLHLSWRDTTCADLPPPSAANGVVRIPLTGVRVPAGGTGDLVLTCDLEAVTAASGFELAVPDSGLVARDANLATRVALQPGAGGIWPCTSGFTRLVAPADELLVNVTDRMPPLLAGDGTLVELARVTLRNGAPPGSGPLLLSGLTLRADGRDLGETCAEVTARLGEADWAAATVDSTAALYGAEPLAIPAGETVVLSVHARFRAEATGGLRVGLTAADIHAVQPDGAIRAIRVRPAPGTSFPFWTAAGTFSGLDLASSYLNFPNPFAAGREATSFAFSLPQAAEVSLRILTARGEGVVTLVDRRSLAAGLHQDLSWDGRNGRDQTVHNGVYVAELLVRFADGQQERLVRKVAVVR